MRLGEKLELLSTDELRVVESIIDGLVEGREVYGPLEVKRDMRRFRYEAFQEIRDYLVYEAAEKFQDDE